MNFPFRYRGEMIFYRPESFNRAAMIEQLSAENLETIKDSGNIQLSLPGPFFGFPITCRVEITEESSTIRVDYSIRLNETNLVFFLSLAFCLFFYLIRYPAISVLFGFGGIVFYLTSLSKTSSKLKGEIKKAFGEITEPGEPELWKQQQEWMKNAEVCPACGEAVNPYTAKCINCGLQLGKPKKHKPVTRESLTEPITVQYTLKKKGEE